MDIKPRGDKLLVKRFVEDEKTKGGILLERKEESDSMLAEVLAVSDEIKDVKVGDKILIDKRANVKFQDFWVINHNDVFGIVNG